MKRMVFVSLVLIILTTMAGAEEIRWIPVAASNPGLHDTQWTTDLWIYNRVFDAEIQVYLAFFPDAEGDLEPHEVMVTVAASSSLKIDDVVGQLLAENRPGAIRLRSEHPFEARSRTMNSGSGQGTYGQGIEGQPADNALFGSLLVGAANDPGPDGVRTNLGFVNPGEDDGDVFVVLSEQDTVTVIGTAYVELGPHGWYQANVFDLVGAADHVTDNAVVTCVFGRGLLPYLSRVDNRSGDATTVLPFTAQPVYTVPTDWQVDLTLTYSGGVTIDSLVYTGRDGADVTVSAPPSGFTVDLEFVSPAEFCYTVVGSTDSSGGQVVVEVLTARDGGLPASHRSTVGNGSAGPIESADCTNLY